ncbi:MAG: A24 family peptidase [Gemmatimonadota bacterium]
MTRTDQIRTAFAVVLVGALLAACWTDARERRVANQLTVVLLAVGLVAGALSMSAPSLITAFLGVLVGLAIWLPFWLLGLLGAGDVKFFAAASAWIGPSLAWRASLGTAVLGGVLALLFMVQQRGVRSTVEFGVLSPSTAKTIITNAKGETATASARTFPYAIPMAMMIAVARFFPTLFS